MPATLIRGPEIVKDQEVVTSYGPVSFDEDGVLETEHEELVSLLLSIPGYSKVQRKRGKLVEVQPPAPPAPPAVETPPADTPPADGPPDPEAHVVENDPLLAIVLSGEAAPPADTATAGSPEGVTEAMAAEAAAVPDLPPWETTAENLG